MTLWVLTLAGCEGGPTGPDLATVEQQCGAATRPFEDSWPCIRVEFAGRQDGYPGVRLRRRALWSACRSMAWWSADRPLDQFEP
jgi:hypothetical protein